MSRKSVTFKLNPFFNSRLASQMNCLDTWIFVLRLAGKRLESLVLLILKVNSLLGLRMACGSYKATPLHPKCVDICFFKFFRN